MAQISKWLVVGLDDQKSTAATLSVSLCFAAAITISSSSFKVSCTLPHIGSLFGFPFDSRRAAVIFRVIFIWHENECLLAAGPLRESPRPLTPLFGDVFFLHDVVKRSFQPRHYIDFLLLI